MDTVLVFDNHFVSINSVIIFFSKCTLSCVLVFLFVTIVVLYMLYVNKNKIRKKSLNLIGQTVFELESGDGNVDEQMDKQTNRITPISKGT